MQKTISSVQPATWERINQAALSTAFDRKIETGATIRVDSTVTDVLMHEPADSSLLVDAVRMMVRLLRAAVTMPGCGRFVWRDHNRLMRKRALAIQYSRGKAKKAMLYRDLLAATEATVAAIRR